MDKLFKKVCLLLSVIIVISSISLVLSVQGSDIDNNKFDFFSCNRIVDNINNMEMNMTTIVYIQDKEGNWVENCRLHGDENRIWISRDKMPENLKNAFIAIEDQNFFYHNGVDWKRTGAAFLNWIPNVNLLKGNQGGSTLTQQLIKNITLDNDQNAKRKIREIIRALSIEKILDKDTILEAYLNTISLGNGICGVEVAANYYFNKDVSELTLGECACLAAITKNPTGYNPIKNKDKNEERRLLVLDQMYKQELITYDEYSNAYDEEIVLDTSQSSNFEKPVYNYFIDTLIENITEDLSEKYNCDDKQASQMLYNNGYKIYATMDSSIQGTMEKLYENYSPYFTQKRNGANLQSSMTITDYNGHILGIVGGVGKKTVNRGLNRAYSAPRQPGSTMKPIGVYAPAIDNGVITYASNIEDKPLEKYYKDGKPGPKEWYGYYAGNMTIQKAIERSANTIPCHILKDLTVDKSYKFLTEKLGLKHLNNDDKNIAALALGGCTYGITSCESAAAYAVFGNGGKYYAPKTYFKVERPNGEVVLEDNEGIQAISPATSAIMNKLLQNVVYGSQGTGRGIASYSKMKAYAKTGTSTESNDLWMVAGTPYYVGSVWCGFDKNGTIYDQGVAARIWKSIMTDIHKELPEKTFDMLPELEAKKYCRYTGKLKGPRCYSCQDGYFLAEYTPEVCDGVHKSLPSSTIETKKEPEQTTQTSSGTEQQNPQTPTVPPENIPTPPIDVKPDEPPVTPPSEEPVKPETTE